MSTKQKDTANSAPKTDGQPVRKFNKSATDIQREKIQKLMANPDKEVFIPTLKRDREVKDPNKYRCEIMYHIVGSSAGAGSGEFHLYRLNRRREENRMKKWSNIIDKEELDKEFDVRQEEVRREEEDRAAKKRAKRKQKKMKYKERKKVAKKGPSATRVGTSETESSDNDAEEKRDSEEAQEAN